MSSRRAIFMIEQPGVVQEIMLWFFHSTFWAFLCISRAPFGQSSWSGYHWKEVFLLHKLSIDDANFGRKRWCQKWKKGRGSSQPVTGGTGVNGLINTILFEKKIKISILSVHYWQNIGIVFNFRQKSVLKWSHLKFKVSEIFTYSTV